MSPMPHECIQCQAIEDMKKNMHEMDKELAVAKADNANFREDIKGIKGTLSKFNWWLIGIMATTILTLLTILFKK